MSTNKSKEQRELLLGQVGELRRFVSVAPQDENTGKLLTYLSNLEKDIKFLNSQLKIKRIRKRILTSNEIL